MRLCACRSSMPSCGRLGGSSCPGTPSGPVPGMRRGAGRSGTFSRRVPLGPSCPGAPLGQVPGVRCCAGRRRKPSGRVAGGP
eukprot:7304571-Lingulodinium_polyedra.AAC.1